jgi:hypothetical protein
MPGMYCIDPEKNLVLTKYRGDMTISEQIQFLNILFSDPCFQSGMDSISDLTEANYDWQLSEIDQLRSYVQMNRSRIGNCKWALISRGGITAGNARVFQILNEVSGSSVDVRLFQKTDEAWVWLGRKPY